jgi:biotin carboxyl carrier protein
MHKAIIGQKEFLVETNRDISSVNGKEIKADIIEIRDGKFHILVNHKSYSAEIVEVIHSEKKVTVKINQTVYQVLVRDKYDELLRELGMENTSTKQAGDVKAPMPGLVLNVLVQPGQIIKKGDAIIVLEAMKMENILKAVADGEVKKIHVKKGDKVEKNQVMVNLV